MLQDSNSMLPSWFFLGRESVENPERQTRFIEAKGARCGYHN